MCVNVISGGGGGGGDDGDHDDEVMKIWPHCGPTNARLRLHLPLLVPAAAAGEFSITVGNEQRHWSEGTPLVFDDSYRHEVVARRRQGRNTSSSGGGGGGTADAELLLAQSIRLVLIVDVWNPGVPLSERAALSQRLREWSERGARLAAQDQQ